MSVYQHNPYYTAIAVEESPCPSPGHNYEEELPAGTLHGSLVDDVTFVPYPAYAAQKAGYNIPPKDSLVRVFIGQLPYNAEAGQAEWIIEAATGHPAFYTEIIHSWGTHGNNTPKGCVHTYCFPQAKEAIVAMSKRILVDDTGIWVATDDAQAAALTAYTDAMKCEKQRRIPNRPFQAVVLEVARSSFIAREPQHSRHANVSPTPQRTQRLGSMYAMTPPPSYDEFNYYEAECLFDEFGKPLIYIIRDSECLYDEHGARVVLMKRHPLSRSWR